MQNSPDSGLATPPKWHADTSVDLAQIFNVSAPTRRTQNGATRLLEDPIGEYESLGSCDASHHPYAGDDWMWRAIDVAIAQEPRSHLSLTFTRH